MSNNSSLSKVLVTNSTGLSLNERFTAISSQSAHTQTSQQRRSRSRSVNRTLSSIDQTTSAANQRLLQQLQRKHKLQAALKLKRRSMRNIGGSFGSNGDSGTIKPVKRGTVKAFRVGANGKPIRTNSLTNVATMKADREVANGRRSLHRVNSSSNLAGRLGPFGPRRPTVGGAAQRVARRRLERQSGRSAAPANSTAYRGNTRSRSRTRAFNKLTANPGPRPRQQSRSRNISGNNKRSRSRSLNRARSGGVPVVPVKARLGMRSGAAQNSNNYSNRRRNYDRRSNSLSRRGVATGRVQKRRNITKENVTRAVRGRGRMNRTRERSAVRNANVRNDVGTRSRSRSSTRRGRIGQSYGQQRSRPNDANRPQQQIRRRSRSQQRRSNTINNNKSRGQMQNQQQQQQQRHLRSRSRNGTRGKTNQGENKTIKKEDLDKELDQYMATTRTENDMDYLLKN
uniref:FoP_duplication domain-containing protein n=1 Tax=Glossina brevipalpis TaxID=37001 RepID=A0A1A9W715_9MUSC